MAQIQLLPVLVASPAIIEFQVVGQYHMLQKKYMMLSMHTHGEPAECYFIQTELYSAVLVQHCTLGRETAMQHIQPQAVNTVSQLAIIEY